MNIYQRRVGTTHHPGFTSAHLVLPVTAAPVFRAPSASAGFLDRSLALAARMSGGGGRGVVQSSEHAQTGATNRSLTVAVLIDCARPFTGPPTPAWPGGGRP